MSTVLSIKTSLHLLRVTWNVHTSHTAASTRLLDLEHRNLKGWNCFFFSHKWIFVFHRKVNVPIPKQNDLFCNLINQYLSLSLSRRWVQVYSEMMVRISLSDSYNDQQAKVICVHLCLQRQVWHLKCYTLLDFDRLRVMSGNADLGTCESNLKTSPIDPS